MKAFNAHLEQFKIDDRLSPLRERAWERFSQLGLPQKKDKAFQYFPLRELYAAKFAHPATTTVAPEIIKPLIYPECQGSVLIFVNGTFCPELSQLPKQIVVMPLAEAMGTYGQFLQNRNLQMLKEEQDPFVALNAAIHTSGAFVYIPPKLKVASPIQVIQIITAAEDAPLITPRLQVFVGSCAEVQWVTQLSAATNQPFLYNGVMDVALENGALFHHVYLSEAESAQACHFEALRATLKQDSQLESVCVTRGSKALRQDFRVALLGKNASADLQGIWMLQEQRQAHTHVVIDHIAPNCQSNQRFKGVLDDTSQSSFEGKIHVRAEAQQTNAYQLNNNLILSDNAMAYSKPNLEIFADDVKASHGTTVSQLDASQLFYLKTRGLSPEIARRLLLLGFCKEVIDAIPHTSIREAMTLMTRSII